jgi:hypothetical protein
MVPCRSFTHAIWLVTGGGDSAPVAIGAEVDDPEVEDSLLMAIHVDDDDPEVA